MAGCNNLRVAEAVEQFVINNNPPWPDSWARGGLFWWAANAGTLFYDCCFALFFAAGKARGVSIFNTVYASIQGSFCSVNGPCSVICLAKQKVLYG